MSDTEGSHRGAARSMKLAGFLGVMTAAVWFFVTGFEPSIVAVALGIASFAAYGAGHSIAGGPL